MKKILIAAFIIAAILVLATGCNGGDSEPMDLQAVGSTGQSDQGNSPGSTPENSPGNNPSTGSSTGGAPTIARPPNAPDMDRDMGGLKRQASESTDGDTSWPAEILPQGLPVYPGGEILFAGYDEYGDVFIYIEGTDAGVYNSYRTSLGSAGWDCFEEDEEWSGYFKDGVFLFAGYAEGDAAIYVFDLSEYFSDISFSWPADELPDGFPVYPGEVDMVGRYDTDIFISIRNTDRRTFDGYVETLRAAGWRDVGDASNGDVDLVKDTFYLGLSYSDNGEVFIGLYFDDYSWGFTDWPSDLPFYVPEYTDGEIALASNFEDGSHNVVIYGTSHEAIDRYVEKLIEAGGELDEGNTPGYIKVWMGANGEYVYLMASVDDEEGDVTLFITIDIFTADP